MSIGIRQPVIALFVVVLTIGCRRAKEPEFAPVHGVVRVNGVPERGLSVSFAPDPEKGTGIPAFARSKTDEQGRYTMKYEYRGKEGNGAPVGWQRAIIIDTKVGVTPQGQEPKPSSIPYSYSSLTTTPLLKEVKSGDNTIDLDVQK